MTDSLATRPRPDGVEQPHGTAPRLLPGAYLTELDSGAREQTYLLSLPDGRNFQLAGPLYHLVSLLDGERDHDQIASELSARMGRAMDADDVAGIIDRKLAPFGILAPPGLPLAPEPPPSAPTRDSALGIFARLPVVPPRILEPLANATKYFYAPVVAVPVVLAIVVAHIYAYQQLAPLLTSLSPANFPIVAFLLGMVCIQLVLPWHELGHAAAARYFGARHGPLGVGLMGPMLVAFVEVTDIWRLPRWRRFVVDIGGVYFQAMSVVVLAAVAWWTGNTAVLWIVLAMDIAMLMNLNPLFKLDGYWAFSDATGITNLHQRVGQQFASASAGFLLRLGRLFRVKPVHGNVHLHDMAGQESQLQGYGLAARVALVVFSILFVVSLLYFGFMILVLMPMMLLSYPLLVVQAVGSVAALVSGGPETTLYVMSLIQFMFVTMLLVGVAGMAVQFIRARRAPNQFSLGGGMGWRGGPGGMNGMSGMGW